MIIVMFLLEECAKLNVYIYCYVVHMVHLLFVLIRADQCMFEICSSTQLHNIIHESGI